MIRQLKKYRLMWNVNSKELISDPYMEYSIKSETVTNSSGYYECDSIEEVDGKINELKLIYVVDDSVVEVNNEFDDFVYIE